MKLSDLKWLQVSFKAKKIIKNIMGPTLKNTTASRNKNCI